VARQRKRFLDRFLAKVRRGGFVNQLSVDPGGVLMAQYAAFSTGSARIGRACWRIRGIEGRCYSISKSSEA
jgi:hypothetical protein